MKKIKFELLILIIVILLQLFTFLSNGYTAIFGSPSTGKITQHFLKPIDYEPAGYYYDQNNKLKSVNYKFHHGLDIAGGGTIDKKSKERLVNSDTKKVYAVASDEVVFAGFLNDGYGHQVIIYHGFNINGNKKHTYTMYSHLGTGSKSFITVKKGAKVSAGKIIGRQGNSGNTGGNTGIHLDFEIRLSSSKATNWTENKRWGLRAASPDFYLGKQLTYGDKGRLTRITAGPWSTISSKPQLPKPKEPTPLKPIPVKNVTIVLIIDDSGSMQYNDPDYQRTLASKFLVDLLSDGDRIALVGIADDESLFAGMKQIKNQADREFLKNKIQLHSNTATNIDAALALAKKQIEGIKGKTAMVMLTDGAHMPTNRAPYNNTHKTVPCPIYTILLKPKSLLNYASLALGSPYGIEGYLPSPAFLSQIAQDTGGAFKESPATENLRTIYQEVTENIQGEVKIFDGTFKLGPKQTIEKTFPVNQKTTEIKGTVNWHGSTIKTILISPSGEIYNPEVTTENYEVFRILNPEIGNWKFSSQAIDVLPTGESVNFHFSAKVDEEPPEVSFITPKDTSIVGNLRKIRIKAADNIEVKKVVFYADNRKVGNGSLTRKNIWEINWKPKRSGEYYLKAIAFDKSGNSNSTESFIVVDRQKPKISKIKIKTPSLLNKKTTISYKVSDFYSAPIRTWVIIENNQGQLVKTYNEISVYSEKNIKLFWNNKNSKNNFVPAISHEISIYAQDKMGNVEITRRRVKIFTIQSIFASIKSVF